MSDFEKLGVIKPLIAAVQAKKYGAPTPIQEQAIPMLLEGNDLLGLAQTGTGKTAAFALPTIQRLLDSRYRASRRHVRALILAPTRELTEQIYDSIKAYSGRLPMQINRVFGGVPIGAQFRAIQRGLDILVATPGRLMDLYRRGGVEFSELEVFILDEADQMLDLGFIEEIREIEALLPKERQTMLFSATMPREIASLAKDFLRKPKEVKVAPAATVVETIDQKIAHVLPAQKDELLLKLLGADDIDSSLVFTLKRVGAQALSDRLNAAGVPAAAIHGNLSQEERQRTLDQFRRGKLKVLVATDVAARGLDITGISQVINYDMPNVAENYVHRIGRTARAGRAGLAYTFCLPKERGMLSAIQKLTRQKIEEMDGYKWFKSDEEPKKPRTMSKAGPAKGKGKGKPSFGAKGSAGKGFGKGKPAAAGKGASAKPAANAKSGAKPAAKAAKPAPQRSPSTPKGDGGTPTAGYLKRK